MKISKPLSEYQPDELVEVIDIEVVLPIASVVGGPVKVTYTVREHAGDVIEAVPGQLVIKWAPRDITLAGGAVKRLPADSVLINLLQVVMLSKRVRLEPKHRPTVGELVDPEKAALEQLRQQAKATLVDTLQRQAKADNDNLLSRNAQAAFAQKAAPPKEINV